MTLDQGRHVGVPYNAKRWKFTIMDKDAAVESQECLLELYREQHRIMSVSTRSIELNLSFKLRLNRFCAFETLSSWLLVGNFIHSFMASSYSKTCCEFHTHHDWLRLEEQTFDMSKREKWPEYHEHL